MAEDLNKICRTCLMETDNSKPLFIVQYINEEPVKLSDILAASASIQVQEEDNLPKQVCYQCEFNILSTFSFQQQCQKSDSLLRALKLESTQGQIVELRSLSKNSENGLFVPEHFSETTTLNFAINKANIHAQSHSFVVNDNHYLNSCTIEVTETCDSETAFTLDREDSKCLVYTTESDKVNNWNASNNLNIQNENSREGRIEDETLQPLFPCEIKRCTQCFTSQLDLKRHRKTHFTKHNYCETCNKTFSSASTLSRHTTSKHQPLKKIHACPQCGKCFARSDDLKRHIRVHTGEKPFSCEKCGKAFAQSFRLLEHMRSHSDVKNFICAVCGKGFARYTSLLAHNKTHNKEKSHECTKCGKRLCGPGSLSAHMKIHTGQKDYSCNFCGKSFASPSNLVVHKRTHTGERPYCCLTCGKSFPDNSRLNVHSRIHSGEKPYVCSYCLRGCVSSTQLKRHIRIHTGEKPYSCELCSKMFRRREDLKNHVKMHNDERSHVCPVCSKGFFQRSTLKVHLRIHTGEKPYSCDICNASFSQTGPYSIHMKTHTASENCIVQNEIDKNSVEKYL